MNYVVVFVAVTAVALGVLAVMPSKAKVGVKVRLSSLETVGGALVPVEGPRKRRQAPRARKRSLHVPRKARLALMSALLFFPVGFMFGVLKGLAVLCLFLLTLGCGDLIWKSWSIRMVRRQLPSAIRLLAERLRATNSFFTALEAVERSGMQPIAGQFGRIRQDVSKGVPEEQALERLAARIPILETEVLAKAIAYHPQKGQRLATSLDRIAELFDGRRRLKGVFDGAWRGG